MKYRISICLAAWLLLLPMTIQAEDAAKDSGIPTIKIVLHPMAAPQPALKYQLLPSYIDRKPGNAALFYNKLTPGSRTFFNDEKMWDNAADWAEAPLPELRKKEVQKSINDWTWKIKGIRRASLCESCDWQIPFREQGYAILLPEIEETRSYARLLAPYARLQIAEGKYDDAVETLQAGYALARNVGNGQLIVQNLVGTSIAGVISNQLQEFIQQPDAPNLYWALTDLPKPLVDYRSGWEGEKDGIYITFPELQHIDKKDLSPDQWRILFHDSVKKALSIAGENSTESKYAVPISTVLLMQKYPLAKDFLVKRGWPADKVNSMPICQVVLIAGLRQFEEVRDDYFKWFNLPFTEAIKGLDSIDSKLDEFSQSGQEIIPIASMLLPSLNATKNAEVRGERQIAALRVLEAIRLYAADHNGRLPGKLEDITQVPIPLDPVYGKTFIYYLVEGKAILESPAAKGMSKIDWLRYEITLKSKGN